MKDMTAGPPGRLLVLFALPLLAGNVLTQLYGVADTMVVGRFLGRDALAAVGASLAVTALINSVIMGLGIGAGVLFSHLYGAGDFSSLRRAVFMTACFIPGVAALLSAITILLARPIVAICRMPPETVEYAVSYLRCIFSGLIPLSGYLLTFNLLRSVGDARTPLLVLIIAEVLNVGLDIWFVVWLNMGVFGAAFATVLAQVLACVLAVFFAFRRLPFLTFHKEDLRFDRTLFRRMLSYSVLTSVQQSVMNLGILMVQGLINTYGAVLMAAFAAAGRIDSFVHMPGQDFGNAFSMYTAQNTGAGRTDRVAQGMQAAIRMVAVFSLAISLLVFLFARPLVGLFVQSGELQVVETGAYYLRIEGSFYILVGFLFLFYGFFRGLGRAGFSVILTVASLGTRVLLAYSMSALAGWPAIFWSIPVGWLLADLVGLSGYRRWKKKALPVAAADLA